MALQTPLSKNTISHLLVLDSYQLTFFKDSKRPPPEGAGQCREWLLEWRTAVTKLPCHYFPPGTAHSAWQPERCSAQEDIENLGPSCELSAFPDLSLRPLGDPGSPPPPPAWPKLWTPCVYVNRAVAGGHRLLSARGLSGACSPLFVYLVSVVTEGQARPGWVSGATRCWGPSCPST